MPAKKKPPFQERLEALDALVGDLERGELPLEAAITRFEEGRKLHAELLSELEGYEKRIEKLVSGPDGETRTEPVVPPDATGGADG